MSLQLTIFTPKSEWIPPLELPDITSASRIAIDVETRDPNLKTNGLIFYFFYFLILALYTVFWRNFVPWPVFRGSFTLHNPAEFLGLRRLDPILAMIL